MASFGNQIFGVSFVGITGLESSIFVGQISTVARDTASLAAEILASNNLNWRGSCISGSWGFNIKSSVVNWVALTESYMCVCVELIWMSCGSSPTLLYSITSFVQVLCQKIRIHYLLAKHRTGIPAGSTLQISQSMEYKTTKWFLYYKYYRWHTLQT